MSCRRSKGKHAFKVRGVGAPVKYGIASNNLKELLHKACAKLQLPQSKVSSFVLEDDGTEIEDDDALLLLPHNTRLVLLQKGQEWQPSDGLESASQLQHALTGLVSSTQHKQQVIRELQNKMTAQTSRPLRDILAKVCDAATLNPEPSDREQHPQWFTALDSKFKTKEAFMRERSKARIRGYLNTARDFAKESHRTHALLPVLKSFDNRLKEHDFYSCYFDRSVSTDPLCMCDDTGWFGCEGAYDVASCEEVHQINPYGSLTERITFSTWNLDHRIEKSREVLPQLLKAVECKPARKKLNWEYFYDLMFTRTNLKLVHIACHDKKEHTAAKCDPKKFYV